MDQVAHNCDWFFLVHAIIGAVQAIAVAWLVRRRVRKDKTDDYRWRINQLEHRRVMDQLSSPELDQSRTDH